MGRDKGAPRSGDAEAGSLGQGKADGAHCPPSAWGPACAIMPRQGDPGWSAGSWSHPTGKAGRHPLHACPGVRFYGSPRSTRSGRTGQGAAAPAESLAALTDLQGWPPSTTAQPGFHLCLRPQRHAAN
uniref:Uncharacterized protein n=1 Tax=Varanus komodoensis TaxID=61221 RepID=A0A8D2JDR6_VARKO